MGGSAPFLRRESTDFDIYKSSFKMLKGVGMEVAKSVNTWKYPCSKTDDDGMQQ